MAIRCQYPPGGHYDRDTHGHLTGLAEESAGNAVKLRLVSTETGVPASVENLRAYAQRRLSEGVTTVQIMGTNETLEMQGEMRVCRPSQYQ